MQQALHSQVLLQRTCGCVGDEECEECEGVRVTLSSASNLPLVTTPGPRPKLLTLEDLNLAGGRGGCMCGRRHICDSSNQSMCVCLGSGTPPTRQRMATQQPAATKAPAAVGGWWRAHTSATAQGSTPMLLTASIRVGGPLPAS